MGQADVLDRLVPITSFNKGHASKIFGRARSEGALFVLKNNAPEAVIVSPEDYARMSEAEENYALLLEAVECLEANAGRPGMSMAEVMAEFGIADEEPTEETRRAMVAAEAKALGLIPDDAPVFHSAGDVLDYLEA